MNNEKRKLIVFEKDCIESIPSGEKQYVKFIDENKQYVIIYMPVIAPRYLKCYIEENGYEIAYEIENENDLNKYEEKIYTLTKEDDKYKVTKGIELIKKRILLVDTGMNLDLNLPKYNYEITDNGFKISKIIDDNNCRSYCYVANEDDISPELKKIMLPVVEIMPDYLSINSYPFIPTRTYKKKRRK